MSLPYRKQKSPDVGTIDGVRREIFNEVEGGDDVVPSAQNEVNPADPFSAYDDNNIISTENGLDLYDLVYIPFQRRISSSPSPTGQTNPRRRRSPRLLPLSVLPLSAPFHLLPQPGHPFHSPLRMFLSSFCTRRYLFCSPIQPQQPFRPIQQQTLPPPPAPTAPARVGTLAITRESKSFRSLPKPPLSHNSSSLSDLSSPSSPVLLSSHSSLSSPGRPSNSPLRMCVFFSPISVQCPLPTPATASSGSCPYCSAYLQSSSVHSPCSLPASHSGPDQSCSPVAVR